MPPEGHGRQYLLSLCTEPRVHSTPVTFKEIFSMRRLEIAGTVGLLLYVPPLLLPSVGWEWLIVFLQCITTLVIACHVWLEGCRWQMAPAYFLTISLIPYECVHWLWGFAAPYLVGIIASLFVLAAIVFCILLPVFRLPAPTGPYKVGTQIRHIVDQSRRDPFSDNPGGPRELVVQIWYPAAPSVRNLVLAPYRDRRITT